MFVFGQLRNCVEREIPRIEIGGRSICRISQTNLDRKGLSRRRGQGRAQSTKKMRKDN